MSNSSKVIRNINTLASQLPPSSPSTVSLNPLSDLIQLFNSILASTNQTEHNRLEHHTIIYSLTPIFTCLIKSKRVSLSPIPGTEQVQKVISWTTSLFNTYLNQLSTVIQSHFDPSIRSLALKLFLQLLSLQPSSPNHFFYILTPALLQSTPSTATTALAAYFTKIYLEPYHDIRYYFLLSSTTYLTSLPSSSPQQPIAKNFLSYLTTISTTFPTLKSVSQFYLPAPLSKTAKKPPLKKRKTTTTPSTDTSTGVFDDTSSSESESDTPLKLKTTSPLLSLPAYRKQFSKAFLAVLGLEVGEEEKKRVLERLHREILPGFGVGMVGRLRDWLGDEVDLGGTTALLALNGLFTLITKHNLEYPDFFTKVYALLDRMVLHSRYRARFFRMLGVFMGSTHLSANLVASFIKKLSRLSLTAPTPSIVILIPFIYNLFKLHPSTLVLIHRTPTELDPEGAFVDPFLDTEPNPLKTNALESSLWEISTLKDHYSINISGLAKMFDEVLSKQNWDMEDFLDHGFGTMFESELTRKIKNSPALAPIPKRQPIGGSFFPKLKENKISEEEEAEEVEPVDIVSDLWRF